MRSPPACTWWTHAEYELVDRTHLRFPCPEDRYICLEPITVKNNLRIDRCLFGFSALELWGRSPNEAAVKVSR